MSFVDVPAKLAARVRLFDTGHNSKTDARDAHSIAVVAVRTDSLRVLVVDGELEALRMLNDRRETLTRPRGSSYLVLTIPRAAPGGRRSGPLELDDDEVPAVIMPGGSMRR